MFGISQRPRQMFDYLNITEGGGVVTVDFTDKATKLVSSLKTSHQQNLDIIEYMKQQVGKTVTYHMPTNNCRTYSRDQYNIMYNKFIRK